MHVDMMHLRLRVQSGLLAATSSLPPGQVLLVRAESPPLWMWAHRHQLLAAGPVQRKRQGRALWATLLGELLVDDARALAVAPAAGASQYITIVAQPLLVLFDGRLRPCG